MIRCIDTPFFSYPVTDMTRSRAFYEGVLGLGAPEVFENEGGNWVEYSIGSGTLAITDMAPDWKPAQGGGSVGIEVEDFDVALTQFEEKGVPVVVPPMESPVCRFMVIADPDGSPITIHKVKKQD